MARRAKNWLKQLEKYVEDTEAPRDYWLWGGIYTLCSALQRKVWIPYGLDTIYPNLFLLIVAPPGERKAGPPTLAKKILQDIQVPVSVDSSSKRALTKELHEIAKTESFDWKGKRRSMASIAVISKELSSLLAVDPKGMIEVLTDLYDPHDIWKYKTSDKGEDTLFNVCVTCFFVTTQSWLAKNLPSEAIGGGFTSRFAMVHRGDWHKDVPWPEEPSKTIYETLRHDLLMVNNLVGPFEVPPETKKVFNDWYGTIKDRKKTLSDPRMLGFLNRMHVIALKVAMGLHVAYSDKLILTSDDIGQAITLVDNCVKSGSEALGGQGENILGHMTDVLRMNIASLGVTTQKELLSSHWRNLNSTQLEEIMVTLEAMGHIKRVFRTDKGDHEIRWVKKTK